MLLPSLLYHFVERTPAALRTGQLGLIVLLVLVGLLIQRELLRVPGHERGVHFAAVLDVGILPLLLLGGVVCLIRLITLVYPL